jgi:hypothetical protein
VTLAELAAVVCLASGIFGRPAWDAQQCEQRAALVLATAERHSVDPVVMVAVDVLECELRDDVDAPFYKVVRGRRRLAGYDACPMGVRVRGVARRRALSAADIYDEAASRLAWWRSWCQAGHPGRGREPSRSYLGRGRHSYVAHYNWGNPDYAAQVLAVAAALRGRQVRDVRHLSERAVAFVRRIYRAAGVAWQLDGRS